jgi:hypothetical protein
LRPIQNQPSEIRRCHEVKVECRDIVGRRRAVRVILLPDNTIALIVPPGEVALLGPDEVLQLRTALRQAVFIACDVLSGNDGLYAAPPSSFLCATIPCADAVGRKRAISVRSMSEQPVVLIAPAGGVAVLQPLQVGRMRATLRDARAIALHRETLASEAMQVASPADELQRVVA